jgi:hypothetical protein
VGVRVSRSHGGDPSWRETRTLFGKQATEEMRVATVGRVLAATTGRLFAVATRCALQRDLDDIATHAERPDRA